MFHHWTMYISASNLVEEYVLYKKCISSTGRFQVGWRRLLLLDRKNIFDDFCFRMLFLSSWTGRFWRVSFYIFCRLLSEVCEWLPASYFFSFWFLIMFCCLRGFPVFSLLLETRLLASLLVTFFVAFIFHSGLSDKICSQTWIFLTVHILFPQQTQIASCIVFSQLYALHPSHFCILHLHIFAVSPLHRSRVFCSL